MNLSFTEIKNRNKIPIYSQIERMNPYHSVTWAGIIGNSESSSFERALAETIEESSGYQLTRRSIALRDICCDLEKVHWYLKKFENLFSLFKDHILQSELSYLKFCVEDCFENWSGARSIPRLICLGGVNRDLKLGHRNYISGVCKNIREELLELKDYILDDPILQSRLLDCEEELQSFQCRLSDLVKERNLLDCLEKPEIQNLLDPSFFEDWEEELSDKKACSAELFYILSFYQCIHSLQKIEQALVDLPEGDHRVFIEHLHIPGNYFFHQKFLASSGWVFSYYCSGKIRFSSFSSRILSDFFKDGIDQLSKASTCLIGLDAVQGVNCGTLV